MRLRTRIGLHFLQSLTKIPYVFRVQLGSGAAKALINFSSLYQLHQLCIAIHYPVLHLL